ncbi:MAG: penicillin-binding protein 2 [Eubacterium sp.]|nr:penicillin-binding protein 2 [Eubacterium sp.]
MKEKQQKKKTKKLNREMAVVTYLFLILFLVMAGYVVYFVLHDSDQVLNNPQNQRQELMAKRVKKGSVLSDNGKKLAYTKTDKSGKETRVYPYNGLFAHVVGRTSHGKTGIESMEGYTMLTSGINPIAGMVNQIKGDKNPGNNVVTTLNLNLSQIASNALGDKKGAVVVMEPDTGKILAMVSKPTYNPNLLSDKEWERLTANDDDNSPLYNRATQGLYPPGSTFKLYTALEYMREEDNSSKFAYRCTGSIGTGSGQIKCYGGEVHGKVNLTTAFSESCNAAFCQIGSELDVSKWRSLCESLYYNKSMPLDKMEQRSSRFAVTRDSEKGDIMQASIGQGDTLVSPLQNAFLVCAAVNEGTLMKPYVVDRIEDSEGNVIEQREPSKVSQPITEDEAKALKKLMRATVTEGTATALNTSRYKAGGKTGSAEFQNGSTDSHAWFIGYGEKDGKKLVVSIVVEAAGTGSAYAVPIAKRIFDGYW